MDNLDLMTVGMYLVAALVAFFIIKTSIKIMFYVIILGALGYVCYLYVWPSLQSVLETM